MWNEGTYQTKHINTTLITKVVQLYNLHHMYVYEWIKT